MGVDYFAQIAARSSPPPRASRALIVAAVRDAEIAAFTAVRRCRWRTRVVRVSSLPLRDGRETL
jgi:hypothetical protein